MAVGLNQESMVWIGPTSEDELARDFLLTFGQSVMLEADSFRGLSEASEYDQLLVELGKRRGLFCPVDKLRTLDKGAFLSPGSSRFFQQYKDMMKISEKVGAVAGSFCVDVSQDPAVRPRCGAWFPAFTRSSRMMSASLDDLYTNSELDFAMGFPAVPLPPCAAYRENTGMQVNKLPYVQYCKLLGNGMHVAALQAWWSYVFCHCFRKADLQQLEWPPPVRPSLSEDVEEAGQDTRGRCADIP